MPLKFEDTTYSNAIPCLSEYHPETKASTLFPSHWESLVFIQLVTSDHSHMYIYTGSWPLLMASKLVCHLIAIGFYFSPSFYIAFCFIIHRVCATVGKVLSCIEKCWTTKCVVCQTFRDKKWWASDFGITH